MAKRTRNPDEDDAVEESDVAVEERTMVVPPFGIEADHPRNDDLLIQVIPNCRLRSAIDGTKGRPDQKTGELQVPLDQAKSLASFPRTPGMQLHVNPAELTYAIVDPMHDNDELCDKVTRWLKRSPIRIAGKINGVPPRTGSLDKHQMKTLCREMLNLVTEGAAKKCKGPVPSLADIEELPGQFLLNPGSRIPNLQPRYESGWDKWVEQLSMSGG